MKLYIKSSKSGFDLQSLLYEDFSYADRKLKELGYKFVESEEATRNTEYAIYENGNNYCRLEYELVYMSGDRYYAGSIASVCEYQL